MERGLAQLRAMVQEGGFEGGAVPWEALFRDVLGDRQRCEDESALPDTGLPPELERAMSSIFVEQFSNKARQGFDICQWHMCALDCNCASTPPEQHDAGPTQGNVLFRALPWPGTRLTSAETVGSCIETMAELP